MSVSVVAARSSTVASTACASPRRNASGLEAAGVLAQRPGGPLPGLEALDRARTARRRSARRRARRCAPSTTVSRDAADAVGDDRHAGGLRLDGHDAEVLLAGEQQRARAGQQVRAARRRRRSPRNSMSGRRRRARARRSSARPVADDLQRPAEPHARRDGHVGALVGHDAARRTGSSRRGRAGASAEEAVDVDGRVHDVGVAPVVARGSARPRSVRVGDERVRPGGGAAVERGAGARQHRPRGDPRARPSPRPPGTPDPTRSASACGNSRRAGRRPGRGRSSRRRGWRRCTRSKPRRSKRRNAGSSAAAASGSGARAPGMRSRNDVCTGRGVIAGGHGAGS